LRTALVVLALGGLTLDTGRAAVADPKAVLRAVDRQARTRVVVRGDGVLEPSEGPAVPIVLLRRGTAVYVEAAEIRALVKPGKAYLPRAGKARRAPVTTPLGATGLVLEDLVPFTTGRLAVPQLSDDGPLGIAITGAPRPPTAYALLVVTVDPERAWPTRAKYYEGSISNLTKMRRDEDPVAAAGRLWPATITFEHFHPSRTTRLRLAWRAAPELRLGLQQLTGPSLLAADGSPAPR